MASQNLDEWEIVGEKSPNSEDWEAIPGIEPSPYEAAELKQPGIGRAAMGPGTEFTTALAEGAIPAISKVSKGIGELVHYGVGVPTAAILNQLKLANAPQAELTSGQPTDLTPIEAGKTIGAPLPLSAPEEKGVIPELSRAIDALRTPESIGLTPLIAAKPIQALLAAQALAGVPESVREITTAQTPAEVAGATTKTGLNLLMGGLMGKGLARSREFPSAIEAPKPTGERIPDAIQQESPPILRTMQEQPIESAPQVSTEKSGGEAGERGGEERQAPSEVVLSDYDRYQQLTKEIRTVPADQKFAIATEIEAIKNRQPKKGFPPEAPAETLKPSAAEIGAMSIEDFGKFHGEKSSRESVDTLAATLRTTKQIADADALVAEARMRQKELGDKFEAASDKKAPAEELDKLNKAAQMENQRVQFLDEAARTAKAFQAVQGGLTVEDAAGNMGMPVESVRKLVDAAKASEAAGTTAGNQIGARFRGEVVSPSKGPMWSFDTLDSQGNTSSSFHVKAGAKPEEIRAAYEKVRADYGGDPKGPRPIKATKPPISKSEQAQLLSEAGMNEPDTQPSAPTPESAQGKEPRVTSIKNEIVDKERAARGLPPAMEPAKRSFGTVWDEAMKVAEENPRRQDELVAELRDKPRALTDLEDALLLHRQVELQNQYTKEVERLNTAAEAGDQVALHESRLRGAKLEDDLLDIYNIGKRSGTESGRGLNARKMLAAEDFSLASMVAQKRAASGGAKLNDAQTAEIGRLKKIIDATQKALDEHVKKAAERRAAQEPRATEAGKAKTKTVSTKAVTLDPEAQRLKAAAEQAKIEFKRSLVKDRLKQRPLAQKTADTLVSWRRAMLLSSPVTLAKLTAAALERFAFTPIEEAVGWGIGQVPGISKIAKLAPRQGGLSVRAEAKALTDGVMKGMTDARDILRKGQGELEVFGRENLYPRDWLNFFGEIHAALKAPTKRNEFARSFQKRVEFNIRKGIDVTDPIVQTRIAQEAYRDSNRSIFMQDNRVVSAYKAGIRTLEASGASKGAKAVASTAKFLLPIVKVPTNIVAEALQHATGLVTGSVRAANALRKGVEKLKPEEADLIMQDLKKGSLGGALMLTGFLLPEVVGGYYQPGQKRKKGDVKFGSVQIGDTQLPSYLLHNPLLEMLQLGATIRRVADSRLKRKDQDPQGLTSGAIAGALGLLDEVPFLREVLELRKAFDPNQRAAFEGELAKSTVVPAGVEWLARQDDVDIAGEVIKRDPKTVWQHIQSGLPILRRDLPRKKTQ